MIILFNIYHIYEHTMRYIFSIPFEDFSKFLERVFFSILRRFMKSTERLNKRTRYFFVTAFFVSFVVGIRVEMRSNTNLNKLRVNDAIFFHDHVQFFEKFCLQKYFKSLGVYSRN